jgi:predicted nuclease of restriction endonuclease-like (RecB) superfamily
VNPDATCFSETNLLYMKNFYLLYHPYLEITPQLVEQIRDDLFSVPWGHHRFIIDKFKEQPEKALFFVHQTVENGWSRDMLLNFMGTDLYERQGKALTNFARTLPEETSGLARELTKDPYDFAFTGITGAYNERLLILVN